MVLNDSEWDTVRRQQKWLHFVRHCLVCQQTNCMVPACKSGKALLGHMKHCSKEHSCPLTHCVNLKALLRHYINCKNKTCYTCHGFRQQVHQQQAALQIAAQAPPSTFMRRSVPETVTIMQHAAPEAATIVRHITATPPPLPAAPPAAVHTPVTDLTVLLVNALTNTLTKPQMYNC